jgi:FkbM family methyltransferase
MNKLAEFVYTVLCKPKPIRWLVNRVLVAISPDKLRFQGAVIHLNHADPILCGALTLGVFEKDEIQRFTSEIKDGMCFVDIGANIGLYTALALRRMKTSGLILAIEPTEENFVFLEKNIKENREPNSRLRVITERVALADRKGEAILHKNPENKGDNRLYQDALLKETERVSVISLDEICAHYAIPTIDMIKMDVQGMELRVLLGASSILEKSPTCTLFMEFWASGIEGAGDRPALIFELLEKMRFRVYEPVRRQLLPLRAVDAIRRTQGRKYMNIIAKKYPHE